MPFTDADLKQLKNNLAVNDDIIEPEACDCFTLALSLNEMSALLARLEAAEQFNSLAKVILSKRHIDEIDVQMLRNADRAWHKRVGK